VITDLKIILSDKEIIEKMTTSYQMLFEIENKLRLIIKTNMTKKYGYHWSVRPYAKQSELQASYAELVAMFTRHSFILPHFNNLQRKQLGNLYAIRNDIAHSRIITKDEYEFLKRCHRLVMRQPITKRKKLNV